MSMNVGYDVGTMEDTSGMRAREAGWRRGGQKGGKNQPKLSMY